MLVKYYWRYCVAELQIADASLFICRRAKIRTALMLADSHHVDSPVIIIVPNSAPMLIMDSLLPIGRLLCICGLLVHFL